MLALLAAAVVCLSGCSLIGHGARHSGPFAARTRQPTSATSVLSGGASVVAASAAQKLFASAPVVIVANIYSARAVATGVSETRRLHAPLLLVYGHAGGSTVSISPLVRAEIKALKPHAVLAVGVSANALSAKLRGVTVTADPASLPATRAPAPVSKVVVLVRTGDVSAKARAAIATARVAGAQVFAMRGYDPRAYPAAITALAALKPNRVLAVGAGFGPAATLAGRVAVAETGVQLPHGGEILFPTHRLVALYGAPGVPGLGILGDQDLSASIARVRAVAAMYRSLSKVPIIPTFEIIATVAQGRDEPEGGTYSYVTPVSQIRPWVTAAAAAGIYVVLDLQAGRASLLSQAKYYQSLLERPNVGLAIDPEWKLGPDQFPLEQIGSVSIGEVNGVASWLAALTARHHLPQKLLVLHQFRLSMIQDEQALDTHHDDLAIVIHMDGQGTPGEKQATWDAVIGAAPRGVFLGWKDFTVKDHPMLTPWATMDRRPQPVMISYQ
jgi:hypothetical protein